MITQNASMTQSNLPSIYLDNPEFTARDQKNYSYYRALSDLKNIDKRISIMKNRISLLTQKQQQAQHPVSDFFEERETRLRTMHRQYKETTFAQLQHLKQKSLSELTLRKIRNESNKKQNQRRIGKARRIITEQKFKRHDIIFEKSIENKHIIERLQLKAFLEKQMKHNSMIEHSRKSKANLKELQDSRISTIRAENKLETNKILEKIVAKERELREIESTCQKHEEQLKNVLNHKTKKFHKMPLSHKPLTLDTASSRLLDPEITSTPRSTINFVIIP